MGRFDDAVSGIRAMLGRGDDVARAARVDVDVTDPQVVEYLNRLRRDELGRLPQDIHGRPILDGEVPGWPPGTSAWGTPVRELDTLSVPAVRAADMSLGSPLFDDMARAADTMNPGRMRQRANVIPGGRRGSPNPAGDLKRIAAQNIEEAADASRAAGAAGRRNSALANAAGSAAVVGGAAGLGYMAQPGTAPGSRKPKKKAANQDLTESGNPADLQAPPVRDPLSETMAGLPQSALMQKVDMPAEDYSMQARQLINQLNDMRRKAGGEVPQAQQMMQEINRLLALGDKQRNTPGYKIPASDPARDPYQQARTLIDQVNAMQSRGIPHGDPRVQRLMAQVRQLQAQGDAIRNNRKNYR